MLLAQADTAAFKKVLLSFNRNKNRPAEHKYGSAEPDNNIPFLKKYAAVNNTKKNTETFYRYHIGRFGKGDCPSVKKCMKKKQTSGNDAFGRKILKGFQAYFS